MRIYFTSLVCGRSLAQKPTKEDLSNVGGKREFARALLQRNRKLIKKIESLRSGKVETPTTFEVFSRKMMKMMSQQLEMLNSLDRRMAVIEGDVGEIKRSIAVTKNGP